MKQKLLLCIIVGLLLMGLAPSVFHAQPDIMNTADESTADISVTITFANYTDLDDDGLEDDVYATVDVSLTNGESYTFDYFVKLTLPSGLTFSYLYVITTNYQSFTLINYFYDHAIESGWYTLDVSVKLHTGGGETDENTLIFDPPGGSSGGDPDHDVALSS